MSPRSKRVTASQVGQYAYCARAWWLGAVEGHQPADLSVVEEGTRVHERHGWQVALARRLRTVALVLLAVALLSLALWGLRFAR